MARPDGDCCSVDDHERCLQYGLSCLCCLCVSGLDYVSAELWLFCCSVSVVHFASPVRLPCDASLATVTHDAAGDKINSESNNGITVAGWIESAFDEPTSQERINRGSRRRVLHCAYWCSRVSGLPALIGLPVFWLVLLPSLVRIFPPSSDGALIHRPRCCSLLPSAFVAAISFVNLSRVRCHNILRSRCSAT